MTNDLMNEEVLWDKVYKSISWDLVLRERVGEDIYGHPINNIGIQFRGMRSWIKSMKNVQSEIY